MAIPLYRKKTVRLGKGFADSIARRHSAFSLPASMKRAVYDSFSRYIPHGLYVAGIGILLMRLFFLTVVSGTYYKDLAENNRVREERIPSQRGVLYDRNGTVLAENRPIYKICGNPAEQCTVLSREQAIEKETADEEITVVLGREYLYGPFVAHVTGYMSEVNKEQMEERNARIRRQFGLTSEQFCYQCYGPGDFTGVSGIELSFEDVLRGTPGKRMVEVDSQGKELRELSRIEPVPGKNIYLSIDLPLQRDAVLAVEAARLGEEDDSTGGVVIASDPRTSEVLAFYSSPTYDPNVFAGADSWETLWPEDASPPGASIFSDPVAKNAPDSISHPGRPLFDRGLSGLYPPGSTFKIVTAVAGLEEGVIDESTLVEDTGILRVGAYSYGNWYFSQYGRTEGEVNIVRALGRSNDIFFYKLGEWLQAEKLEEWAHRFKADEIIDTELEGEIAGTIRRDRDWYLGDTYHLAIGQGDMLVTPLHVHTWTQTIAKGGTICTPSFLKHDVSSDISSYQPVKAPSCETLAIDDATIDIVSRGLESVCATGGTAWPLFDFPVHLACKTGTAEFGHPEHKTHAWLTAYGPADNPEIVVTALLEEGGEGSSATGPIVKAVMSEWFGR